MAVRATLLSVGLACGAAEAALITVNSSEDVLNTDVGNTCTLRKAVESINQRGLKPGCVNTAGAFGNNDTIELMPELSGSTITLAGEELLIDGGSTSVDLTLHGSNITINPDSRSRGFRIARGNALVINNLTISNGSQGVGGAINLKAEASLIANNTTLTNNQASLEGGAIGVFGLNDVELRSTVILNNCTISDNRADAGAGIFISGGNAQITDSSISNNTVYSNSDGGGLSLSRGQFVLNRVTVDSNQGTGMDSIEGGGIDFSSTDSSLEIINSTISNNAVSRNGAGLSLDVDRGDSVTITNSTITSNVAGRESGDGLSAIAGSGGGITLRGEGTLVLQNTTVFNNSLVSSANGSTSTDAAGIDLNESSSLNLVNSIIASSFGGVDCNMGSQNMVTADQFNIIQDGSCATNAQAVNPLLEPLADNGGTTKTHLPNLESTVINSGDNSNCQQRDQRGKVRQRSSNDRCDIGAVEVVEEGSFFVVPMRNGKAVIFEL